MADDTQNENFQWIPAHMPEIFEDVFAEGTARQETLVIHNAPHHTSDAN
ncbi:hypothetical protein K8B33_04645 [Alcanivorax sp. JB21]|nr:hypothetical protein [Alcanivorax limicola]MBZ2188370.1 hypothetical protein [Alcanivorax limicola]